MGHEKSSAMALVSALYLSRSFTQAVLPYWQAMCRGVNPPSLTALTAAEMSSAGMSASIFLRPMSSLGLEALTSTCISVGAGLLVDVNELLDNSLRSQS